MAFTEVGKTHFLSQGQGLRKKPSVFLFSERNLRLRGPIFWRHCVQSSPEAHTCLHKKINFWLLKVRPETLCLMYLSLPLSSHHFPSAHQNHKLVTTAVINFTRLKMAVPAPICSSTTWMTQVRAAEISPTETRGGDIETSMLQWPTTVVRGPFFSQSQCCFCACKHFLQL